MAAAGLLYGEGFEMKQFSVICGFPEAPAKVVFGPFDIHGLAKFTREAIKLQVQEIGSLELGSAELCRDALKERLPAVSGYYRVVVDV